jgi:hypothetical protein
MNLEDALTNTLKHILAYSWCALLALSRTPFRDSHRRIQTQRKLDFNKTSTERDGQHDFDFWFGNWKVHNRRLQHPLTCSNSFGPHRGYDRAGLQRPIASVEHLLGDPGEFRPNLSRESPFCPCCLFFYTGSVPKPSPESASIRYSWPVRRYNAALVVGSTFFLVATSLAAQAQVPKSSRGGASQSFEQLAAGAEAARDADRLGKAQSLCRHPRHACKLRLPTIASIPLPEYPRKS